MRHSSPGTLLRCKPSHPEDMRIEHPTTSGDALAIRESSSGHQSTSCAKRRLAPFKFARTAESVALVKSCT
eukprot:2342978-Amphidinium_carterae.1